MDKQRVFSCRSYWIRLALKHEILASMITLQPRMEATTGERAPTIWYTTQITRTYVASFSRIVLNEPACWSMEPGSLSVPRSTTQQAHYPLKYCQDMDRCYSIHRWHGVPQVSILASWCLPPQPIEVSNATRTWLTNTFDARPV